MLTLSRTPLLTEAAQDIIEHVNEGHVPELLLCVRAFTPVTAPMYVQVTALYAEGFDLNVTDASGTSLQFVPYTNNATSIRELVGVARAQLGVKPDSRVAHWQVLENRPLTWHFRRLVLDLQGDTRDGWAPGDACRFDLPGQEHGRPYTLRRTAAGQVQVDVYCHDQTPGSVWAANLQVGDTVTARGERQEKFPDFSLGTALLLGDETALPTIAALLETWPHEQPVRVLLEVTDPAEQRYLDDVPLPQHCHVTWLPRQGAAGEALLASVEALDLPLHAIWGATEANAAKKLRNHLKTIHPQPDTRITGYWRDE